MDQIKYVWVWVLAYTKRARNLPDVSPYVDVPCKSYGRMTGALYRYSLYQIAWKLYLVSSFGFTINTHLF